MAILETVDVDYFPLQTTEYVLAFQFSSWYPQFSSNTIKSTIIRPLSQGFVDYLNADGVSLPEGSEDTPAESSSSDGEDEPEIKYAFPALDAQIRDSIKEYGAIFPKLNFTSPKDASWILPPSSPLKCTSPADIYMLLKSSDFINHDLDISNVFSGCDSTSVLPTYSLELVLRKWYPIDNSRELRCFVRHNKLVGISQRDTNYYHFLNETATQEKIVTTVKNFWDNHIKNKFLHEDYIFDFLLTRDLTRGHIVDFNPYAKRTDPLLFTFSELQDMSNGNVPDPHLRVIDSRTHPAATRTAPAHLHNMLPFEALSLSNGQSIQQFAQLWNDSVRQSTMSNHADDDD